VPHNLPRELRVPATKLPGRWILPKSQDARVSEHSRPASHPLGIGISGHSGLCSLDAPLAAARRTDDKLLSSQVERLRAAWLCLIRVACCLDPGG
jgi:hypothetical protein